MPFCNISDSEELCQVSNLFVALVPEAVHESGAYCNYTTWLSRGRTWNWPHTRAGQC